MERGRRGERLLTGGNRRKTDTWAFFFFLDWLALKSLRGTDQVGQGQTWQPGPSIDMKERCSGSAWECVGVRERDAIPGPHRQLLIKRQQSQLWEKGPPDLPGLAATGLGPLYARVEVKEGVVDPYLHPPRIIVSG